MKTLVLHFTCGWSYFLGFGVYYQNTSNRFVKVCLEVQLFIICSILQMLSGEISPFLCSGAHLTQVDCHPSAIEAFLEAFLRCKPTIFLRPFVLKAWLTIICCHAVFCLLNFAFLLL